MSEPPHRINIEEQINVEEKWSVYKMYNPSMPFLLKIGYSKHSDIRSKQLYYGDTGVPIHFEVKDELIFSSEEKAREVERKFHQMLYEYRVNLEREFFGILVRNIEDDNEFATARIVFRRMKESVKKYFGLGHVITNTTAYSDIDENDTNCEYDIDSFATSFNIPSKHKHDNKVVKSRQLPVKAMRKPPMSEEEKRDKKRAYSKTHYQKNKEKISQKYKERVAEKKNLTCQN